MSKKKKEDNSQPGTQGIFYAQKRCDICERLIIGHSGRSYRVANSDLGQRLKIHKQECQKKQLKLSLPGPGQGQTISRVTLRGDRKT